MVSDLAGYIETGEDFLRRTEHGETVRPDDARRVVATLTEALRESVSPPGEVESGRRLSAKRKEAHVPDRAWKAFRA